MTINYSAKRGKYVTKNMFRNMFLLFFYGLFVTF